MLGKRMIKLIDEAAKCFDDGYSPFETEWLSKHEVTLDECIALSNAIGIILHGYAKLSQKDQMLIITKGAVSQ